MTETQRAVTATSGIPQSYRIQLYRCLNQMLISVINCKEPNLKLRQLRERVRVVYTSKTVNAAFYDEKKQRGETKII